MSGLSNESKMTANERRIVDTHLEKARMRGAKIVWLPALIRRINPVLDLITFLSLVRLIYKEKPDIVHTHSSKAGLVGRMAASLLLVPIIVHTPHGHVFHGHFNRIISAVFLFIEKAADKITDCTVALTSGERDDYLKLGVSKPRKLVTIHSGVNVEKFMKPIKSAAMKRSSLGVSSEDIVVGTVGWLLPIKGPGYLLNAMQPLLKKYPTVKLIYIGKGELGPKLKMKAKNMGAADRVLFPGWRDDIHAILPIFDIFVLPSLNEGMGRVIVEAMAAGKPVVASHTGGIPDLVIEGETGFLVEPRDIIGLTQAIDQLIVNQELRQSMGERGKMRCYLFSEERMVAKIDYLYQNLLVREN